MGADMAIRVHATVTVPPDAVAEALDRAREMLRADPNVLRAEIGPCLDAKTGEPQPGRYVVTTVFTDHDALHRYATGPWHLEVLEWSLPLTIDEHVAVHAIEVIK